MYPPGTIPLGIDNLEYLHNNVSMLEVQNGTSLTGLEFPEDGLWKLIFFFKREDFVRNLTVIFEEEDESVGEEG